VYGQQARSFLLTGFATSLSTTKTTTTRKYDKFFLPAQHHSPKKVLDHVGFSATSSFTANPLRLSKHLLPNISEKVLWFRKLEIYLSPGALFIYAHALSCY
jgi:hypothetical protein